jgi:glycosyltransferase involved in cell wall biosynthesis
VARPHVVLLRGYSANPWDLRPWVLLADRFEVSCLVTGRNDHEAGSLGVPSVPVRALRDLLPRGRAANAAAYAAGDRYLGLEDHLKTADIVHSADLGTWFSAQAARLKRRLGYRLVLTIWETIPLAETYRWRHERRYRRAALEGADVFMAAAERSRECLLLEGVRSDRIVVSPPGIDNTHFAPRGGGVPPAGDPLVVSAGRLVWEKGHQDVIRAVAALRHGLVAATERGRRVRVAIVGVGPEEGKLRRYAAELGVAGAVDLRGGVPYAAMPDLYAAASCLVLASLQRPGWEEQFGMVLAEALASGVPIAASSSGAIPEVAGETARTFTAGDWIGLARTLAEMLATPRPHEVRDAARVHRYSSASAAERIAGVYGELLTRR